LSRRTREDTHFMYEWYKDIQKPVPNKMNDVVLNESGNIDIEKTFKLRHELKKGIAQNE
jgi:hypothetical protein